MDRVLTSLSAGHDWPLVVLAGVVCFLASLTGAHVVRRARTTNGRGRRRWIAIASAAAGCGIWAAHLIATLAGRPGLAFSYDIVLAALSLFAAVAITGTGFALAVYDKKILSAFLGGAIVGLGVAFAHYLGIWAVHPSGRIIWSWSIVGLSVGQAVCLGSLSLAAATRREGTNGTIIGAILLTLTILSHHFSAMGAVQLVPDPTGDAVGAAFSPVSVALLIASTALAVLGASLAAAVADRRQRRLASAVNNMSQGLVMFDAAERLVACNDRYLQMYGLPPDLVKPGCTLRDVIGHRIATGSLDRDLEQYRDELLTAMAEGRTVSWIVQTKDGRDISVANRPIGGGDWIGTHEDITVRRHAERELERTKSFLDTVVENVPEIILVKDVPDLRYVFINRAAEQYMGIPREHVLGKTASEIFPEPAAKTIAAHDRELLQAGRQTFFDEHTLIMPGGEKRIVTSKRLPIAGEDGKPRYLLGVIEDVTERREAEARIAHLAKHDALTELPNRTGFSEHLQKMLGNASESLESFALLCIDLDRFKEVNDVFGHSVGDELLQVIARRLQAAGEGAFVARLGGDEFGILTAGNRQASNAAALADRLLACVANDVEVGGRPLRMGFSIGVAVYPSDGMDDATLMSNADAALYRAKAEGRGTVRFFEPEMDKRLRERRMLQHDLHTAIGRGEFRLYYQPQARINGEITGFEALLRWHHPERGVVAPAAFIPIAEESGLIVELGEWALREACREAASWPNPLHVSVNLSPVQFKHGDLDLLVHSILLETGLAASRLELEITENALISDFAGGLAMLRRLKALGLGIAMDDFGSGYSSLSYLHSFPFDKIKIDRTFVSNINRNPQSVVLIRGIIALGHGLDLPIVAEGVETKEQLDFLAQATCDEVQGYYIGRPLPIEHYAAAVGVTKRAAAVAAVG
jgi:diguanylate cyclase (GGDEF)-like protein/PAS domain S-box-containing protein